MWLREITVFKAWDVVKEKERLWRREMLLRKKSDGECVRCATATKPWGAATKDSTSPMYVYCARGSTTTSAATHPCCCFAKSHTKNFACKEGFSISLPMQIPPPHTHTHTHTHTSQVLAQCVAHLHGFGLLWNLHRTVWHARNRQKTQQVW